MTSQTEDPTPVPNPSREINGTPRSLRSSASVDSLLLDTPPLFDVEESYTRPSRPQQPPPANFFTAAAVDTELNLDVNPFQWDPSTVGATVRTDVPHGEGMMGLSSTGGYDMMSDAFGGAIPPSSRDGMFPPSDSGTRQGWPELRGGFSPGQMYAEPMAGIEGVTGPFLPEFLGGTGNPNDNGYSTMHSIPPLDGTGPSTIFPGAQPFSASASGSGQQQQQQQASASNHSPWEGFLSSAQEPYNVAFHKTDLSLDGARNNILATGGTMGEDMFAPFNSYAGAGGAAAFAAEAQAIIGNVESGEMHVNWLGE